MKHLFRFVAALGILVVPAAAHAQPAGGFRVGVNLADVVFDPKPPFGSETLTGVVAGIFLTFPLNEVVAFQTEGLYSRQGTKFSAEGMTVRTKFDYLQLPQLARIRLGKGSPVAALAGTSIGIKTNASFSGPGVTDEISQDFEDDVKAYDIGLVAGIVLDAGHFVIDGRYTWGLTNIAKDSSLDAGETASAKHRVLSLSAGVRF